MAKSEIGDFRKKVFKSLIKKEITREEAKAVLRNGINQEAPLFLESENDPHLNLILGCEKIGLVPPLNLSESGEEFCSL